MKLFIRKSAKVLCDCNTKGVYNSRGKPVVYSLLIQNGKSLKVWATICSRCVNAFLESKIMDSMNFTEIFYLTNEDVETAKLPSFLERTSTIEL